MASTGNLWWITPVQCLVTLSAAVNFGASGFQTPITMPVLRHPDVPAVHTGTLVTYLLHRSEVIFPKLNLVGTVGNLAMAVAIYLNRNSASPAIKAANPYILASLGLSLGVSAYALTVMVPINTAMKNAAKVLKESPEDKDAEKTLRENQEKWQGWNMGRGSMMMAGAVVSLYGILAEQM